MQKKAERREQLKDDPYYILDDTPSKPTDEEVNDIPVIRLEDMPSIVPGQLLTFCFFDNAVNPRHRCIKSKANP